jgi:hypothetical protein
LEFLLEILELWSLSFLSTGSLIKRLSVWDLLLMVHSSVQSLSADQKFGCCLYWFSSSLMTSCNKVNSDLMKSAVDMEEKLLDLMDDMSIVEGACSLQKEWFEHIIKEH